jgi:hypothetical protein
MSRVGRETRRKLEGRYTAWPRPVNLPIPLEMSGAFVIWFITIRRLGPSGRIPFVSRLLLSHPVTTHRADLAGVVVAETACPVPVQHWTRVLGAIEQSVQSASPGRVSPIPLSAYEMAVPLAAQILRNGGSARIKSSCCMPKS